LKRLYELDPEDQLWAQTQNYIHAPIEWKLYDLSGVHHLTAKDKEIFMLVEKDYPLRKGLALVRISYNLQRLLSVLIILEDPGLSFQQDASKCNKSELQSSNFSVFEHGRSTGSIMSKPIIKFVKEADCPRVIKINNIKNARKSTVKYVEMYRCISKGPKVRRNQRNWNNKKSQQLGKDFMMHNKACYICRSFDHLQYTCKQKRQLNGKREDYLPWRCNSKSLIGHLTYVHPTTGEIFYFRMLLCHRKVGTEFVDVQTLNDIFYPTYQAACEALGLLGDDKEWDTTMQEENKIVLAVASSGIASLLLPSGHTAHSRFKLPLELTEESICRITKNSHLGKLLANTDLIIWDEAPMNDRRCFEALGRSLMDILKEPHFLFGGKSVLLGGDFRQILPVKKSASKMKIISSCIFESELWSHFKVFTLSENVRLAKLDISRDERSLINSFASWLLDIGDGKTGEPDPQDPDNTSWVNIHINYCIPKDENDLQNLINFIRGQSTLQTPSAVTLQQKTIICPKNETADMINSKVLEMNQIFSICSASMELSTIAQLTLESYNKTIEVRVYRKWIGKTVPKLTPTAFCCMLIDLETIWDASDLSAVIRLTAEATIKSINPQREWFYKSCHQCSRTTFKRGDTYTFLDHGPQPRPFFRYTFKANITVASRTAFLTFFTPAADKITGQLVAKYKPADPKKIPPEIFATQGKTRIFQFRYNTLAHVPKFNLDDVFNTNTPGEGISSIAKSKHNEPLLASHIETEELITDKECPEEAKKTSTPKEVTLGTPISSRFYNYNNRKIPRRR
nr:DNA helicase [Tanacetum cinerariifolium]